MIARVGFTSCMSTLPLTANGGNKQICSTNSILPCFKICRRPTCKSWIICTSQFFVRPAVSIVAESDFKEQLGFR